MFGIQKVRANTARQVGRVVQDLVYLRKNFILTAVKSHGSGDCS